MKSYWSKHLRLLPALIIVLAATLACNGDSQPSASGETAQGEEPTAPDAASSAFEDGVPGTEKVHVAAARRRAIVPSSPPLDIGHLLTKEDVQPHLGRGEINVEPLAGRKLDSRYAASHFRGTDATEFGVGLQVWKFDDADDALNELANLRGQYLGVVDLPKDANPRSFGAERAGIRSYLLVPEKSSYMLGLSCGVKTCKDWDTMSKLATTVGGRL